MSVALSARLRRIKPSPSMVARLRAQELQAQGHDIIDLTAGEPDFETPVHIRQAATAAMEAGDTRYGPVNGTPRLRAAIVAKLERENGVRYGLDEIAVGAGAKQVIFNALAATVGPGDEVVIPAPYWVSYPDMTALCDATPVIVACGENVGFKLTPDALDAAITARTRWLILNSPCNPTGAFYDADEMTALTAVLARHPHVALMTDDIYEHIRFDDRPPVCPVALAPELRARYDAAWQRLSEACLGANGAYARDNLNAVLTRVMAEADAANEWIAEVAPWNLAKDPAREAELHAACTLALNLFRLIAGFLKPVLPATAQGAETFLSAPVTRFEVLAEPLLDHAIEPYSALLTRIDPAQIEAMVEASRESLQPSPAAAAAPKATVAAPAAPKAAADPAAATAISIEDFARLDLRIGRVTACEFVEGSDKLLRFELDAGELGTRQIFSGIRAAYGAPEKLVGRHVVFVANLAPRKMRFGTSEGMILSAGSGGSDLFLLDVDAGARAGMAVK